MFESEDLKILLGNSIEEPEVDYDDAEVESELGYPVEEEALKEYFFITIIRNIGKSDFKEEYLSVYPDMIKYPIEQKQVLAESILKRVKKVYNYEPSIIVNTNSESDIINILKFLEFVEYDHKNFIIEIWSYLDPELDSFHIEKICKQNQNEIIFEIEEQLNSQDFSWLITNFLRTYNKDKITEWFCKKSKELNNEIYLKLIEGE